jgi:hypothetical protein
VGASELHAERTLSRRTSLWQGEGRTHVLALGVRRTIARTGRRRHNLAIQVQRPWIAKALAARHFSAVALLDGAIPALNPELC